jgi:lipoprotein-anchoring transpeptidase ErfK/SrfK
VHDATLEAKMSRAQEAQRLGYLLAMVTLSLAIRSEAQAVESSSRDRVRRVVLVSIPDRQLAVMEQEKVIATFAVAVGAPISPSPTGEFQITSRVANPTYYRPGTVIPTGKDNPIGTRWLGLSQKGYGIHGTNAPRSIGRAASHGCIRLRNRDMERLFPMLQVGDVVLIRGERDDEIARVFGGGDDDNNDTVAEAQASTQTGGK